MKLKPGYLTHVKQSNMSAVLRSIWEREAVSRVEIAERTELTSGTLTNLTQELIKAGVIRESETVSGSVGRKRHLLRLNAERFGMIGLDIGRNTFEAVLTDLTGRVVASSEAPVAGQTGPGRIVELAAEHARRLRGEAEGAGRKLLGVGVSIPGPMDWQRGVLLDPPNFPGWERYPVRAELERRLEQAVLVNDDARTSALAERWFGLGRNRANLMHITMGAGIGGGIVMDGELVYGANGLFGQIGHMTVVPGGERCVCGNIGCWETVGSVPGILRQWREAGGEGDRDGNIADFFAAAVRGETMAAGLLQRTIDTLTDVLTNLFNAYDSEVIVLGGKLLPYLARFLPELRARVQDRVYPFVRDRVSIEPASFGAAQSAVGAAALVFDRLLKEPLSLIESHDLLK